jgi:hypothetical protein
MPDPVDRLSRLLAHASYGDLVQFHHPVRASIREQQRRRNERLSWIREGHQPLPAPVRDEPPEE